MTATARIIAIESTYTQRLFQLGPVGFIIGYSLCLSGVAFVLWNALMACTALGLAGYWNTVPAIAIEGTWTMIGFGSILYAIRQWFTIRERLAA